MSRRKTTSVRELVKTANFNLARKDTFATTDYKRAICDFIEDVLMNTGNYKGFGFGNNDDSVCGTLGYYTRRYFI